jgi:flagellar biosynthesis/type III secretory pathway protein FliH
MMAMSLKLEVFKTEAEPAATTVTMDTTALEDARLASYETGYTAGWEDAVAAQSGDQTKLQADIARNLQGLSFTYHEARTHVLRAIEPLLNDIVGRILPQIARETLAPLVVEALAPLAETAASEPITLLLNPSARPSVETFLEKASGLPLTLIDEPTLGEGLVYLRLGDQEIRVDLDGAIETIAAALRGFYDLTAKDLKHG